ATQLAATIPGSLLGTPEIATISVAQAGGIGKGLPVFSNAVPFTVAGPTITALNPPSAAPGAAGFTLTVTGANFVNNPSPPASSQIFFGGTPLATTFVNSTTLTAPVASAMIANPGSIAVVVVNPGGSRSPAATFNVTLTPSITTLNPSSAIQGGAAFTLSVIGLNLASGMSIQFNGTSLAAGCVPGQVSSNVIPCPQPATTGPASLL